MVTKKKTTARAKRGSRERKRSPIGARRLKLSLPLEVEKRFEKDGWHLCWVGERYLPEYKEAEYVHVTQEELDGAVIGTGDVDEADANPGSLVSRYTGRDEHGKREDSYLMKLPMALHKEDLAALEEQTMDVDMAIQGHLDESPTGYARTGKNYRNRGF